MKSMLVFLKAKYCGAKPWRLRLCNWVVEGLGAGGNAQFSQSWLGNLSAIHQSPDRT